MSHTPTPQTTKPPATREPLHDHRIHDREKVRALVITLANDVWARAWKGKSGLSDRSAYIVLLRVAWEHGELLPCGVRVSISIREWAEKAGVALATITAASKRLTLEQKLIRRDGRGNGPVSGAFVLLCDRARVETLTQQVSNKGESISSGSECFSSFAEILGNDKKLSTECFSSRASLRWGAGRLGKTKEAVLDAVRRLGPATVKELAVALDRARGAHHLRRHLDELVEIGVLECRGERYGFARYGAYALECERAFNGELEADEKQREKHVEQRDKFLDAWAKGEVLSKSEDAQLRRERAETRREAARIKREQRQEREQAREGEREVDSPRPSPSAAESSQPVQSTDVIESAAEVFALAREVFGSSPAPVASKSEPTSSTEPPAEAWQEGFFSPEQYQAGGAGAS